ncbi:MAG TPA: YciI family protein [Polyangiaceae bacterium]|nr:YciI family protein [Polyangiaceae bacterium]
MKDYLLLVLEDERAHASESPRATAALIEQRSAFIEELRRTGQLKDSGRLRPSKEGYRVRRTSADVETESGPFGAERVALGAYYYVEAASLDAAAQLAESCPTLASDELDVRPVMKGRLAADKDQKPGKIFACGVLGNAPNERAWVEVMDRIDAHKDSFPPGAMLGGVRLDPPKTGKRVATRGGTRGVFDGPFLESKEVIGGLFFLRLASVDDVLRWASGVHFVEHGALEIRELWRS